MTTTPRLQRSATAEYVVFGAPVWCVPLLCLLGLMWLIANKSQWHEIPRVLWFAAGNLVGVIALTRILPRREQGRRAIGLPTALMLVIGLVTCVQPILRFEGGTDSTSLLIALGFAWPLPIYGHWLGSGLWHRFGRGEPLDP
jgi:hypothetical protein